MSVFDWPRRAWNRIAGKGDEVKGVLLTTLPAAINDRYDLYEAYYSNNDLYSKLAGAGLGPGRNTRSLRNPAHRVVEFHASKLWPEPLEELPLKAKTEATEKAARTVLEWGNWGQQKQIAARRLPMHGDLYLKAEDADDERAYPKVMDPRHFTEFAKDERGFAMRVRLDIPVPGDNGKDRTRTELWDKKENLYRVWEHEKGAGAKIEDLGAASENKALTSFGIDFVPFAHGPFHNGGERAVSAFAHALEPVNELNKMASRANDMLFRHGKPLWQLLRNEAGQGAVRVEDLRAEGGGGDAEEVSIGEGDSRETMIRPPGLAKMESLIPNIPYEAARGLMEDQEDELSRDLPELLYYAARDKGDPSGRALSLILAAAQDRALEARANGETAIIQVVKMCITMAQNKGALKEAGSYAAGDFDSLRFEKRDVLPVSEDEKQDTLEKQMRSLQAQMRIFRELGLDTSPLKKKAAELAEIEEPDSVAPEDPDADVTPDGFGAARDALAQRLGGTDGPNPAI